MVCEVHDEEVRRAVVHAATGVAATDVAAPEVAATGVVESLATGAVAAAADDKSLGVVVSVFQIVWVVVGIEVVADCWTSNHPLCLAKH